ncbi:thioredoxin family protein [Labilibacter marinus]|uniref:thioredoxin family protein n=1 Tax=Labilibacter marinus TaxID=1477105 RepID=UPI0008352C97|nr:thioredoxin family protein [Labilibacter marinus]
MKKLIITAFSLLLSLSVFSKGYSPGDKAIDFKLKNIDDKIVSLSNYDQAKGFIVIFTCNHCPYSVAYEDRIIALDKKYKTKGYPVIAISSNDAEAYPSDSFEKMKERSAEKGFTFPYLYDESQEIGKAYGATRTPHAFVLQKKGSELFVRYIGAIDDNTQNASAVKEKHIENAVNNLLEGKTVKVDFTKAIGCSIKWK